MAIDLDKLEKLAREATPGPWRRGYTLLTGVTRRWSANAIRENDAVEGRRIFSQFTTEDEGRSRVLVAAQADDANAEYIAAANPAVVLELIGELREANTLLKQFMAEDARAAFVRLNAKLDNTEAALREAREALRLVYSGVPDHLREMAKMGVKESAGDRAHTVFMLLETVNKVWAALAGGKDGQDGD